jgi:hypothetical protein
MRTMSEVATDQRASTPLPETPDVYGAYPRLSDGQIATLEAGGARRAVETNETLVREGERSDYFFVILSGKVAVTTTDEAGNRHVIRVHGPRRFLGELGDLEGQAAFYTAEVVEPGEVLVVPTDRVRALVAHDPVLSDSSCARTWYDARCSSRRDPDFASSAPVMTPTPCGCENSLRETGYRTDGLTWNVTSRPSGCCSGSEYRRNTPRW